MGVIRWAILLLSIPPYLTGCGHGGLDRVWTLSAREGKLYRTHQEETYADADHYRCISGDAFRRWLSAWGRCGPAIKPPSLDIDIFIINPHLGLVRAQSHAVLAFRDADGYKCLSPSDFSEALTTYLDCYEPHH